MANLDFRRVAIEDMKGAPDWVSVIINPVNLFMEQCSALINGRLTFGSNVSGMVNTTTFTTPSTYATGGFNAFSFNFTGKARPSACIIGSITQTSPSAVILTPTAVQWSFNNAVNPPQVNILYVAGLLPNTTYSLTLVVF
jgi:hypothetical protein